MSDVYSGTGRLGRLLNAAGVVIVTAFGVQQWMAGTITPFAAALGGVAVLCWLLITVLPRRWRISVRVAVVVMVVTAALTAAPTDGLMVAPVIIGVMRSMSSTDDPAWFGPVLTLVAAGLVALGSLTVRITPTGILSLEAAVLIGTLAGLTRRQARQTERQNRQLLERTTAMREEQAKASVLAARQELARDMHDVLAHSLGGLVLQLDAVEALLEAGRLDEAEGRVRDARALAASGLGEARRAVDTLRAAGDQGESDGARLVQQLQELVDAHTMIAGRATLTERGTPVALSAADANALRRAAQEALSNARKHAPNAPVTIELDWAPTSVRMRVANRLVEPSAGGGAGLAATGGGNGLRGMAERFAELPSARLYTGVRDDEFVVDAEIER